MPGGVGGGTASLSLCVPPAWPPAPGSGREGGSE